MYRFARRPIWLVGHVLAGGLLAVFVVAGLWQLSRHGEVRDRNSAAAQRMSLSPLDAEAFFEAVDDGDVADDMADDVSDDMADDMADDVAVEAVELEYRSVLLEVTRLDSDESVLIRNRSFDGLAGCHLAVPAEVASTGRSQQSGVLVVVGWLNQAECANEASGLSSSLQTELEGVRQIEGRIRMTQQRGLLGPADPAEGRLESLARTDVARIDRQTSLDLAPVYIELTRAADANGSAISSISTISAIAAGSGGGAALRLLPPPELDAGPHLAYTVQWFSFAAVAVIGYTLVLRHQARKGESEQVADD